jgi:sugar lactone lactonase YvrE
MTRKFYRLAAAILALGLAQGPAIAQQYGPPSSGPSAAILFVPAVLSPVAGATETPTNKLNGAGSTGNGSLATAAQLSYPVGMAYDTNGNLFFADENNYVVRRIDHITGDISIFAGTNGTFANPYSLGGGVATNAQLGLVAGLVIDASNNVYVSDRTNNVVFKITPGGTISLFAGGGSSPSTCAGSTDVVGDGCLAAQATLSNPWALGIDSSNNIYVADSYNELVRKVSASTNTITAYAGVPSDAGTLGTCNANLYTTGTGPYLPSQAHLCFPEGIAFDSVGNTYISEASHDIVREINGSTGYISIFAGVANTTGTPGDGGPAIDANLHDPAGVYVDAANRVYISDFFGGEIRMVDSTGNINTVMGNTHGELIAASLGEPDTEPILSGGEFTGAADGIYSIAMDIHGNIIADDSSGDAITSAGAGGAYYFGNQQIYETVTTTSLNVPPYYFYPPYVTISNPSGVDLTFTGSPVVTGPFAITGGTCAFPGTLTPGESCTVIISFTPTADQSYTGTITLDSNSNSSPNVITLTGAGEGSVSTSATLTPNPLASFSSPATVPSAQEEATLTNTSIPPGAPITITGATIGGANPSDFSIAGTTCPTSPATLAGGASCYYQVIFTPAAATSYTAQLQVTVANYGTVNTFLSGTGTPNTLTATLTPSPLAFGGVASSQTSPPMIATLANNSTTTAITGITPSITGTNPTDFSIGTGTNACGATLAASSSCNIYVTFTPASAASFSATLSVADNAANAPQTAALTGSGLSFASNVGTALAAQPVTVNITTAGTLNLIQVLTQGVAGLDFTETSGGTCTTTTAYTVGQTCTVEVIFDPQFAGIRNGAIVITDAGGNVLGTTYLPGYGTGPQIAFIPATQSNTLPAATYNPYGVTLDANGNLYVADGFSSAVYKFPKSGSSYGSAINVGTGYNEPLGVAVDGAGNVYVANYAGGSIIKIPWTGSAYGTQVTIPLSVGSHQPHDIAVDGFGNIYFPDYVHSVVEEVPWTGAGYGATTVLPFTSLSSPNGVAVDQNGDVFLAEGDFGNVVMLPKTSSGFGTQVTLATGLTGRPNRLVLDPRGDVYVAVQPNGSNQGESLIELPFSGGTYGAPVTIPVANLSGIWDVGMDGAGNIYVADVTRQQIFKLDTADAPALNFLSTNVGSTSTDSPKTVSITNIGNASLTYSSGTNPSYPADFPVNNSDTNLCAASSSLTAGSSCDVSINFKPTAGGPLTEDVVLTDNNLNGSGVTQSIQVNGTGVSSLTPQAINFTQPTTPVTYSSGLTIPLVATGGASSNPVVFTIASSSTGAGSITGSTLTVTSVGSFIIDANQAGNSTYSAAPQVQKTVVVSQAAQTISFTQPTSPVIYSGTSVNVPLSAAGGASGNPVVFTIDGSSTGTGSITGSTLTVTSVGNFVIDANQAGNTDYSAATQVQRTVVVNVPSAQAINFTQPTTPVTYSSGLTIPLVATGGASGNAVVFTIDGSSTGAGSITGSTLTVTTVGTFVIDANQAGNSTYSAAPQVQRDVIVNQASQTINFTQPTTPVTYSSGLTIPLVATGGASGNPVVFKIDASSTATGSISGSTVTVTGTGNLVIDANQAGNTDYSAASQVQRTVAVNAPVPDFSVTPTTPSQSVQPGGTAMFTITVAYVGSGFTNPVTLSISGLPTGATGTFNPPSITPGAGSVTSTLTVTMPVVANLARPNFWPTATPVLALLFMLPSRRWRKAWRGKLLLLVAGLASLGCSASLTGCGGGFGFNPPQGNLNQSQIYTLTITGTSGTDTHSTTVLLTVQ